MFYPPITSLSGDNMCHFSVITNVKIHREDTVVYINLQCMYYVLLHFECYEYVSIIHTYTCTTLVFIEIFNIVGSKGSTL